MPVDPVSGPVDPVAEWPIADRFGGVTSGTQQYRQEPSRKLRLVMVGRELAEASPTVAVELPALLFLVTSVLLG